MAYTRFDPVLNRNVIEGGNTTALPTALDPNGIDYGKPVQETVMGNLAIQEDYSRFVSDKKVPR